MTQSYGRSSIGARDGAKDTPSLRDASFVIQTSSARSVWVISRNWMNVGGPDLGSFYDCAGRRESLSGLQVRTETV
jgi:hypothetical protein